MGQRTVNKWKPIKRGEGDGYWDSLGPSDYIILCLFGTVSGWAAFSCFFHKGGSKIIYCLELQKCSKSSFYFA